MIYRLSNATHCRMISRGQNYDLDHAQAKYVSTIFACWRRTGDCKVLTLTRSNAASAKHISAHFIAEGAFAGAEDPRGFTYDNENYIIFNAASRVMMNAGSTSFQARQMFISRLAGRDLRDTSIILTESSNMVTAKNFVPIVTENAVFLVTSFEPFDICQLSFHVATFGVCKRKYYAEKHNHSFFANAIHGGSNTVATASGYLTVVHFVVHGLFGRLYVHKFALLSNVFPHEPVWFSQSFLLPSTDLLEVNNDIAFVSGLRPGSTDDEFILLYGVGD